MNSAQQIFVLYHSADNLSTDGQSAGWVNSLVGFLGNRIQDLIGTKPNFTLISEKDRLPDSKPSENSALIAIVSDNFTGSSLLDGFLNLGQIFRGSQADASLQPINVFKVLKSEVSKKKHKKKLAGFESYFFYDVKLDAGEDRQFGHGNSLRVEYFIHVEDLAFDLIVISDKANSHQEWKYVFLAYTTEELIEERNVIKRELHRYGYKVLPTCPLENSSSSLDRVLNTILEKSVMAIHMLSSDFGEEGPSGKSIPEIQNNLAAKFNEIRYMPRVIWFSPDMNITDKRQQQFVTHLRQDADAIKGAEMYQFPIEHLKSVMHEKLKDLSEGITDMEMEQTAAHDGEGNLVYIVHELRNAEESQKLVTLLENEGLRVLLASYLDDQHKMRSMHQGNLVKCDAVLIHYHDASPVWLRMKLQDIRKSAGFGRQGPFINRGLLFTGVKPDLKGIRIEDDYVIMTDNGDLNSSELAKFVGNLKKMKENKANG